MCDSVFRCVQLRELNQKHQPNPIIRKCLPYVGVQNFECRRNQAFNLHSILETSSPPFSCDYAPLNGDLILIAQEDGLVHLYDTSLVGLGAFIKLHYLDHVINVAASLELKDDEICLFDWKIEEQSFAASYYEAHANAVFDVKWLTSGTSFLTASGDQSIRLLNAETGTVIQQFFGHTMSVRSLSLMPSDSQIFASASRDGSIRLWDIRVKPDTVNFRGSPGTSSVGVLPQCHVPSNSTSCSPDLISVRRPRTPRRVPTDSQSVTSVLFMDDNTLLSAGSTDGSIKMWDLRRVFCVGSKKQAKPKLVLPYRGISQKQSGYSDMVLNSYRTHLFANCLDNVVYEYDLTRTSTRPTFVYTGHITDSFYVKLDISPDDSFLVCGSSDRKAHVYAIGKSRQRPVVLSGHTGEVSVPRWCKTDPTRIITLSDESQAFVWNMFPARQYIMPEPGELAGLAELLPPSKGIMSPSEQERKILRSPRSSSKEINTNKENTSPVCNSLGRSPLASARRRQSNIRHFLEAISPPLLSNPNSNNLNKPPILIAPSNSSCTNSLNASNNSNLISKRSHNLITLKETLGGVVQRFSGQSVGLVTNHSSPNTTPIGCYSCGSTNRSPLIDLLSTYDSSMSSDHQSYLENSENIDPNDLQSMVLQGLPFDSVDGRVLTVSPIVRCSTDHLTTVTDTPSTPTSKRTPLSSHHALFNTPPQSHNSEDLLILGTRKRQRTDYANFSPTSSPLSVNTPTRSNISESVNRLKEKRRRLTVVAAKPSSMLTNSPPTPTANRRRRMTSVLPRIGNPITKYFRRDQE